ncbi:hypothetical protein AXE80_00115 [Wenyingzhuangia fucanilytica]|uniref:Mannosyltransferase n=1 Tax=Wenyingzhuangia fucanilytica TaxID=1790137 RepID=A0A1B1Y1Z7_9FLAO|nr:hypothetical protein [Wenyingzhuangia fucanilytica]ANW94791.1 hypothetical protein AXE80_00115 [Wenyingzhuangia fucanilytica]
MSKRIHIVSFDVPYPPNYGGVVDVFYKLKALKELGVKIVLHTFEYGRGEQKELNKYCDEVYYYKRKVSFKLQFSILPFIVKTRENALLKKRLLAANSAILFEGLHTTFLLKDKAFKNLKKIVRLHNIEHHYYNGLAKSETKLWKKLFFKIEALRLRKYQAVLKNAEHLFSISLAEQKYFSNVFRTKSTYLPVFSDLNFKDLLPQENYVLWHGDLRVSDNIKSALFAIDVVKNTQYKLIIASSFLPEIIKQQCKDHHNIVIDTLEKENVLEELLLKAKVNLLFTYQATGIKLKLLNALAKSRFVIVNDLMIDGSGLSDLCVVANSKQEVLHQINQLMNLSFTENDREMRKELMQPFDVKVNAQKIVDLLD